MTCPQDFAFEANSGTGVAVPFSATAVDDITEEPELVYSHAPGSLFPLGATPVTVSAQDEVGNTSSCTFQVTVRDTVPPRVTCPPNIFVEATEPVAVPYPEVQAVDAVSPVTIEFDSASGDLVHAGRQHAGDADREGRLGQHSHLPLRGHGGTARRKRTGRDEDSGCSCKSLPGGASAWGALLVLLALARLSSSRRGTSRSQ